VTSVTAKADVASKSNNEIATQHYSGEAIMAYVITDNCIKDELCVDSCPTDSIHPKKDETEFEASTQMYVDPETCLDFDACVPAYTSEAIFSADELPEDKKRVSGEER
jgi:ferredoxin